MKTLLFTLFFPPQTGGIENYYDNLVRHWPEPDNIFILNNNKGQLLKSWLWPRWLPALELLYKFIKEKNIDHILVSEILPLGIVTYYVTKLTKTPYTVFLHGMDLAYAQRKKRKRKMAKKILKKARHIICGNSYTAKLAENFVNQDSANKVITVNPGIDIRIAPNVERIIQLKEKYNLVDKIVLFSIGRLVKRKGFDKVIKAMPEVLKAVPNIYYVMAGDGPDKIYIKEKAKGVPNIVFLGQVSDEEKWVWLHLCDIFIMPARDIAGDFEGFGIVYLEANLANKPVIAGDRGGVRDAVKGAETGILVDPENTERIAGAITKLAQDRKLRERLGVQGKQRVLTEFRWEDKVKKIYNLITHGL